MQRLPTPVAALGLVIAAVAVVGWWGAIAVGPAAGPDAAEHIRYAEYLDATGRLPPKSVNYEYSSPPAYQLASVYLQRAARRLSIHGGAVLPFVPAPVRRVGWFALLALAVLALSSRSASRRGEDRRGGRRCRPAGRCRRRGARACPRRPVVVRATDLARVGVRPRRGHVGTRP